MFFSYLNVLSIFYESLIMLTFYNYFLNDNIVDGFYWFEDVFLLSECMLWYDILVYYILSFFSNLIFSIVYWIYFNFFWFIYVLIKSFNSAYYLFLLKYYDLRELSYYLSLCILVWLVCFYYSDCLTNYFNDANFLSV